jgi:hypothetical protein
MMSEKMEEQVQTAMRVPKSWYARADKIAERMSKPPSIRITRTEVLRHATQLGLEVLEAQGKKR